MRRRSWPRAVAEGAGGGGAHRDEARAAPSLLLTPLQLGSVELRNRAVFTAHGAFLSFYRPGEPGDRYIAYQERRAAGGTGMSVLQALHVHHSSQAAGHYVYEPDDLAPKLRRMGEALHRHGTAAVVQLVHFGAEFRSDASSDLEPLWSFSGGISPSGSEASHEMTAAEIESVVEGFVDSAVLAVESGLDGVELHAAHGYLLHQSFSPWGNQREDVWGEPLRFANTVIERVRTAIGPDAVLGLRMSLEDWRRPEEGGLGAAGLREVAASLVATGKLDYLNTSAGSRSGHYARSVADYHHPPGGLLPLAAEMRRAIGGAVPLVGVGRIITPELAEQALRDGACDLTGLTRAQIADPDLLRKYERGETASIRRCVGANQGCVDRMVGGLPITCFHNPDVGRERLLQERRGQSPRRVLVVGGGPAGLAAAVAAAQRGHRASLVERADALGGRLRLAAGVAAELMHSIEWRRGELERLGAEVMLGTAADAALLQRLRPELVVLASGAVPAPERLPGGDGSIPVVSVDDALGSDRPLGRVLLADQMGNEESAACAELLAPRAEGLTMITPMPTIAAHVGFTRSSGQIRRLFALGCRLEPGTLLTDIRAGLALSRQVHSGETLGRPFDLIVAAVQGRPDLSLAGPIEAAGAQLVTAGDARAPRGAMQAFREGDDAGRAA